MLDKIFAAIGMLGVIAFMGMVTFYVMEPDLWVVTIAVMAVGITFFVRELRQIDSKNDTNGQPGPES